MLGKISSVTHELTPMHQRQIIVRLIGFSILAIGLGGVISTAMKWSSLTFIKVSISGLAIDVAGLAYMSAGYHLLRQREFGRVSVLILSWLNFLLWPIVGSYGIYAGILKLALFWPINYETNHFGWLIAISAVSLFFSLVLIRFLNQLETKALFREPVSTTPLTQKTIWQISNSLK